MTGILFYLNQTEFWFAPNSKGSLKVKLDDLQGTARRAAQFWLLQESDAFKAAMIAEMIASAADTPEIVTMIATPAATLVRASGLYQALEGL